MGRPWCADLPIVTVPLGSPKSVTFVYPFYCNHHFFAEQVAGWRNYPPSLCSHLSAIVVDDGSPEPATRPEFETFPISLYRINVDVRWNWLAARNIGAHHADDGWLFLSDMDHVVPVETAEAMVYGQHDPNVVYAFCRREHTGEIVSPHSASFLMTREMFWRIGGYDETLSGHYGTDGDYRRRMSEHARVRVLADMLVRHEYQGDSSTTRYLRKQPQDAAVSRLVKARKPGWTPKVLSFPYAEVTA